MNGVSLARRSILRAIPLGAAALVFLRTAPAQAGQEEALLQPNPWIAITQTGEVRLVVRKIEMGQGAHDALAAIVAEELRIDPRSIEVVQASSETRFGQILTGGSSTVSDSWEPLRRAAAVARDMLERAAAARFGVARAQIELQDGMATNRADGATVPWSDLVLAASKLEPGKPENVAFTDPAQYRFLGRSGHHRHHDAIVVGRAIYGIDLAVPGMLYASLERAPAVGATVAGFDDSGAKALPGYWGAVLIRGNSWPQRDHVRAGVAVLAEDSWTAQQARQHLQVRWDMSVAKRTDSEALERQFAALADQPGIALRREGSAPVDTRGLYRHQASIWMPFLAHAQLEPLNAIARVDGDRVEVWTGTQRQRRLHDAIAEQFGLSKENIVVHAPLIGGAFGRRLEIDYGLEAVYVAKAIGRPVQVLWTRTDEFKAGLFRPASVHRLAAWTDRTKRIRSFSHRIAGESVFRQQEPRFIGADGSDWSMGITLKTFYYDIPHLDLDHHPAEPEVPCGWWRGVAATATHVATECFVDELSRRTRQDPLQLRLDHLSSSTKLTYTITKGYDVEFEPARMRHVLLELARRGDWKRRNYSHIAGMACGFYECPNTYTAAIVRLRRDQGQFSVSRITVVTDCGRIVDPVGAAAQVSGGAIFALGAALWQEVPIRNGQPTPNSFADFRLPRLGDTPEIEVFFVPSAAPPSGLGEPVVPVVMAAVANAFAAATELPIRRFPIKLQ